MNTTRFQKHSSLRAALLAGAMLSGLGLSGCSEDETPSGPGGDPNARIFISSPAAGDTYKVGETIRVQWTIKQDPVEPMDGFNITLSPDSGANWGSMATAAIDPELGGFTWKIPDDSIYIQRLDAKLPLAGSAKCIIRVEQYGSGDPFKRDTSAAFTITP